MLPHDHEPYHNQEHAPLITSKPGHDHTPNLIHPPHLEYPRHPSLDKTLASVDIDMPMFKVCITIVILIRAGLFVGSAIGIPIEWIGMFGALLLIGYRWYRKRIGVQDVIRKTPWHIILFAFSIYVVVYGLHNIGLTEFLIQHLRAPLTENYLSASLVSGGLLTVMSNLFNNLPSIMIGTFTLTGMGLDLPTLHIANPNSICCTS